MEAINRMIARQQSEIEILRLEILQVNSEGTRSFWTGFGSGGIPDIVQ